MLQDFACQDELSLMFQDVCIYITNGLAYTLGVSNAYETLTGLAINDVLGHYMQELEENGTIDRSGSLLAIRTRDRVTILQKILRTGKKVVVTSNPVFNARGDIVMVASTLYPDKHPLTDVVHTPKPEQQAHHRATSLLPSHLGIDWFVAASQAMQQVLSRAVQASMVDSTVLICGESGVGKELIAKIIHQLSPRKNQPFIKVNISSIPEELFESEMFGYKQGAFTGALKSGKKGLVEVANGGTLLLDEVGEAPPSVQVKLLRLLQEKEVRPVGSTVTRHVDVRFIAATNRNLKELTAQGRFREDLFYRLNVLPIHIPPLRERKEDITSLATYFLRVFWRRYKIKKYFTDSALATLLDYGWPGNVRELENLVERLVVLYPEEKITAQQVADELGLSLVRKLNSTTSTISCLKQTLEMVEKQIIAETVARFNGNIDKAAKALGIHRTTLARKLRKLMQ